MRQAQKSRTTSESTVSVSVNLDGTGTSNISTSVPFFDHMLTALSKHSMIDLDITATGDTHIDVHHTVEDTSIVLGQTLQARPSETRSASAATASPPSRSMRPWPSASSMSPVVPTSSTKANPTASSTTSSAVTSPGR
jgi:hypothetical protein